MQYSDVETSGVRVEDPAAQIYVDKILPKGTCNHFKKLQGFSETLRNARDKQQLAR